MPGLEQQQHVHHLLAVARLLEVGDLAAAAIGDAGLLTPASKIGRWALSRLNQRQIRVECD
jgi:hypothetical protein